MPAGRYAPSPTGALHLGNLRTAIVAWLAARATDRTFLLRVEDLDRVRSGAEAAQLAELAAVGLDWDAEPVRQSERTGLYDDAVAALRAAHGADAVYECFCSRKDIAEATSAPHPAPADDDGAPGPAVAATASTWASRTPASASAARTSGSSASTCARAAISGTTPP